VALKNVIGVDHAVVMVRELDKAAEGWRSLGFTVSRVLCWQAKMRIPAGASFTGHWKVRNFAAESRPSGIVTGRSKSFGPSGA
jgi:hypothetical protein